MSVWDWIAGLVAMVPGFGVPQVPVFNGYLEADYVYVAPLSAGRIVRVGAQEGDVVRAGQVLVWLEDSQQQSALRAAEAGVRQARANLDNLRTGGRADEIAVIEASLRRAEADRALAEVTFARTEGLARQGQVAAARLDQDRAALARAKAEVEQLEAQLHVARLPARDAQFLAAEAGLEMAEALAGEARTQLADRQLRAPVTGLLDRRFFDPGEVAGIRTQSQEIKEQVGYMTQRFSLYEDLTIRENLDFIGRMFAMRDRRERVDQALAGLGLGGRAGQLAGSLSGGWKQRLSLAACMLHKPQLLMLDEPTAGVDPKARRDFWDEIRRLAGTGVTVLVSTHYMDEAVQCDALAYIAYGRKLIAGPAREIPAMVGLTTWAVEGGGDLEGTLRGEAAVVQVARFGAVLHVSGTDAAALAAVVARHPGRWARVEGGLEEAFIYLMSGAQDNFAVAP